MTYSCIFSLSIHKVGAVVFFGAYKSIIYNDCEDTLNTPSQLEYFSSLIIALFYTAFALPKEVRALCTNYIIIGQKGTKSVKESLE